MTENINDRTGLPLFCLLLHENEPLRPSATAPLIQALIPDTRTFIWQRREPDPELLQLLQNPDYDPYLVFPADRPATGPRQVHRAEGTGRPLFLIPDGTWKEVRKIVRKSPYLDRLPILSLQPEYPTRYTLRRNPDAQHLCTSEIAALLLTPMAPLLAERLTTALEQFQQQYYE